MTVCTQITEKITIIEFSLNIHYKQSIFMHIVVTDNQLTFLINVSDNDFTIYSVSTKTI